VTSLPDVFPIGKPVKVRIISVDVQERKIVASIRQSSSHFESTISDVSVVDVGNVVEGIIFDIHKDNVVLTLQPTNIRALLSLNNLANRQRTSVPHLRVSLEKGQLLQDLLVVSRNIEKGLVIVASKPKANEPSLHKGSVSWDSVEVGQTVSGRVVGHSRQGTTVKLGSNISASLHPADASDDYEKGNAFPAVDTLLKGVIVAADKDKRQLSISTRLSRVAPVDGLAIVDQEFSGIDQLKVGDSVRGFVKSVANHGLFVYVGRGIDARVQIKELFDDVSTKIVAGYTILIHLQYVKDWQARFQVNQLVKGRIQRSAAITNYFNGLLTPFQCGCRQEPTRNDIPFHRSS
jgi:rRNA biogenesis protein RRP5